ncbi:MAG TPA: hypothetical protein VGU71_11100 [Candidatus Dormibacteraeota bacterium]|nr:hypothetical protein [Candidatus Dormibacteraeota bacterium]
MIAPSRGLTAASLALACLLSGCATGGDKVKTYPVLSATAALAITNSDDGKSVKVAQGDIFRVDLQKEAGWDQFETPISNDGTVAAPLQARPRSGSGTTSMAFAALWPGRVRINAYANNACPQASPVNGQIQVCSVLLRTFEVTVEVVSGRRPTFELAAGEWSRQAEYRLIPGDRVVVGTSSSTPESDNPKVLSAAGQDSSQGFYTFKSVAPGMARLGWAIDPCTSTLPGTACRGAISLFSVNVVVVRP